MQANLTLFKASAGAGKTYQLTSEYLKLMFSPESSFSNVLAVTFTNKATAEMSERILKELHLLSIGESTGHAEVLKDKFGYNDKQLTAKAKEYLGQLLHNYTRFNISTIDSFFQKILKSFTREVGLNVGFNVELNQAQVVEDSVARLFERFHENKALQHWLTRYAQNNLESGKNWDIQKQLIRFTNDALGDVFFGMSPEQLKELSDLDAFERYKNSLLDIIKPFEKKVNAIGNDAIACLAAHNLSFMDFSYGKSGAAGYLVKLAKIRYYDIKEAPGKRVQSAAASADNATGWVAKKSSKIAEVQECVASGLLRCAQDLVTLFDESGKDFFTAVVILSQIDAYAVLVEVFRELISYCDEQNMFLLSMASPLLSSMIGEGDAPFIYEKTGDALRHFMIDEFQDTSTVQWRNFYPLFHNGIAQNDASLVVGDIKQSIYRWRGGDWSLLDSELKKQFDIFGVDEKNLPYNWRSDGRIVGFNNWLFSTGSRVLENELNGITPEGIFDDFAQSTLTRIYENAQQKIPNKAKQDLGQVRVKFIEKVKKAKEDEVLEDEDPILSNLLYSLEELDKNGFKPKDIAIIVRRNTEGANVANFLMDQMQKFPEKKHLLRFVSNDSVFLESSLSIQLIISVLQFIMNPKDKLCKAQVLKLYLQQTLDEEVVIQRIVGIDLSDHSLFLSMLPELFSEHYKQLIQLPLVDLVDRLIHIFIVNNAAEQLIKDDQPFLHTFQDYVLDLAVKNNYDLALFLTWWSEGGKRKPVSISEDQNAIRIITIHKSKGLEFKAVLIPYLDWELGQKPSVLWCKPDAEPFNTMQNVPVMYGNKLKLTHFDSVFYHEQLMAWVDNLNVLYVALTRAEKVLHITAPLPSKSAKMNNVSTLLYKIINAPDILQDIEASETIVWDEKEKVLLYGEIQKQEITEIETVESENLSYSRNNKGMGQVAIRQHSLEYFSKEDPSAKASEGLLYHRIFEKIRVFDDIGRVVGEIVAEGLLPSSEKENVKRYIQQAIKNNNIEHWFTSGIKIYNEQSFCVKGKEIKRPDRVMFIDKDIIVLDYKFTDTESEQHNKQVKQYMLWLAEIEKLPVKGYLWYVNLNRLVEVL